MFWFKKKNDKREEKNAEEEIEKISNADNGEQTSGSNLVKLDVDEIWNSIQKYRSNHPETKEDKVKASTARTELKKEVINIPKNKANDSLADKLSNVDVMVYDSKTREFQLKNHEDSKKISARVLKIGYKNQDNFTGNVVWEPDNMVNNVESKNDNDNNDFYAMAYAQLYNA